MPLRFLIYIGRVYEKLIEPRAIYKEEQIKIPTPEFIVLYNGKDDFPKEKILTLSEAFMEQNLPVMLDLTVRVININYDKSAEVLEKSRTLKDYSYFIYQVKAYVKKKLTLEESIEKAMKDCIKQGVLEEFLKQHGSEVINMLFTEFNLEDAKEVWQEEAERRGEKKGLEIGEKKGLEIGEKKGLEIGEKKGLEIGEKKTKIRIAKSLLDILDLETIVSKTGLSLEELRELKEKAETLHLDTGEDEENSMSSLSNLSIMANKTGEPKV